MLHIVVMQNTLRHGNIRCLYEKKIHKASLQASQLTTWDLNLETFKYLPITQHTTFGYAMNVTGKYLFNANNFITHKRYLTLSFYKTTRMYTLLTKLQLEVKYRDNRPTRETNPPGKHTHQTPGKENHNLTLDTAVKT